MIVLNIAYTISIMSMKKRHQICLQMFEGSRLGLKENIDTALKSTVFIPASFSQTYRMIWECEIARRPVIPGVVCRVMAMHVSARGGMKRRLGIGA